MADTSSTGSIGALLSSLAPILLAGVGSELGGAFDKPAKRKQSPLEQMILYGMANPGKPIPIPQNVQKGAPLVDIAPRSQRSGLLENPIMLAMLMQALGGTRKDPTQQAAGQQQPPQISVPNMLQQGQPSPGGPFGNQAAGAGAPNMMGLAPQQSPFGSASMNDLQALAGIDGSMAGPSETYSPEEMNLLFGQG